jgi:hypothetical protein
MNWVIITPRNEGNQGNQRGDPRRAMATPDVAADSVTRPDTRMGERTAA